MYKGFLNEMRKRGKSIEIEAKQIGSNKIGAATSQNIQKNYLNWFLQNLKIDNWTDWPNYNRRNKNCKAKFKQLNSLTKFKLLLFHKIKKQIFNFL